MLFSCNDKCSEYISLFKKENFNRNQAVISYKVFPGDWDSIYIYGGETSGEEIFFETGYIGKKRLYINDNERFIVYMINNIAISGKKINCSKTNFYIYDSQGNINNCIIRRNDSLLLQNIEIDSRVSSSYKLIIKPTIPRQ